MRKPLMLLFAATASTSLIAQSAQPNWTQVEAETLKHFQAIIKMDTTDPPGGEKPVPLAGNPPSLADAQPGCPFADRCIFAFDRCRVETPLLASGVACHLANP